MTPDDLITTTMIGWTRPDCRPGEENITIIAGDIEKPNPDDPLVAVCNHCHSRPFFIENEPDPCLGLLPGVQFACCGHGGRGYIIMEKFD